MNIRPDFCADPATACFSNKLKVASRLWKIVRESTREKDVVAFCRQKILDDKAAITRQGKNWYIKIDGCIITVNAYSFTIITAHKE